MVQELWRSGAAAAAPLGGGRTLQDVADLHQHAPAMEGDAVSTPLAVGEAAPDFALADANGKLVRLADFRGRNVLLVFYPLDWSPGCSRQLDLYQQELDEFRRRGVEVVGISVDSLYSHGAWAAVRGITFPLLADFNPKGEVARRYQVWRDAEGFSERALYLIDAEGVIRYAHVSPKLQHVPDIYELFDVLDGLSARKAA
jgi:peroxiredoxin